VDYIEHAAAMECVEWNEGAMGDCGVMITMTGRLAVAVNSAGRDITSAQY